MDWDGAVAITISRNSRIQNHRVAPANQPLPAYSRSTPRTVDGSPWRAVPYAGASFRSALLRSQQRYQTTTGRVTSLPVTSRPLPVTSRPRPIVTGLGPLDGSWATGRANAPLFVPPSDPTPGRQPSSPQDGKVQKASGSAAISSTTAASDKAKVQGSPTAMALSEFPRPEEDNGRGMHWVPTMSSSDAVVDRFVKEAKNMKVKWMVFLNDGTKTGQNDYLVKQLVANGIMPVMRVYTPNGNPIEGDLGAMVRHYRQLGVQYFQLYNEPNLNCENPNGKPDVDRYLDRWIPAAQVVAQNGGYPGFGALAPGGNFDDVEFLKQALDKIKQRGEMKTLDKAWLSMHNYTFNHPLDYIRDSNGFAKFKWYDAIIREKLGRHMPIIGTEGGTFVGSAEDKLFPQVDEGKQVEMVTEAYQYMKRREPYNFAYTYWVIANEEGGGFDTAFSHHALFKKTGPTALAEALKRLD